MGAPSSRVVLLGCVATPTFQWVAKLYQCVLRSYGFGFLHTGTELGGKVGCTQASNGHLVMVQRGIPSSGMQGVEGLSPVVLQTHLLKGLFGQAIG